MFKKSTLPKLSSKNLKPIALQLAEIDENILQKQMITVKTPRHQAYKIRDLQGCKTQKLIPSKKPIINGEKLPSIFRSTDQYKQNLLDLDLCFEPIFPKGCQSEKITQRSNFIIRTNRTPSKSSKGKDTSAGSSDSSLQATQNLELQLKNATQSPQISNSTKRGKSYSKCVIPCRIVASKKLPFSLNIRPSQQRKQKLEEFQLDLSRIQIKQEGDFLISQESYCNLWLVE